jgi:hypothetical protein
MLISNLCVPWKIANGTDKSVWLAFCGVEVEVKVVVES